MRVAKPRHWPDLGCIPGGAEGPFRVIPETSWRNAAMAPERDPEAVLAAVAAQGGQFREGVTRFGDELLRMFHPDPPQLLPGLTPRVFQKSLEETAPRQSRCSCQVGDRDRTVPIAREMAQTASDAFVTDMLDAHGVNHGHFSSLAGTRLSNLLQTASKKLLRGPGARFRRDIGRQKKAWRLAPPRLICSPGFVTAR
jgi:hypothetical protein